MGKNVVKLELYNTYNPVVAMLIRLCGGVNKFLPLSNGEGAVVLASASYKCVEGVHPVREDMEVKTYTYSLGIVNVNMKERCKNLHLQSWHCQYKYEREV